MPHSNAKNGSKLNALRTRFCLGMMAQRVFVCQLHSTLKLHFQMWAATRKIMSAIIILIFSGCFSRSESKMFRVLNNSKMNSLWLRSSVHPKPITVCFFELAFSIFSKFDSRKKTSVNDVIEIDSVHSFQKHFDRHHSDSISKNVFFPR